MFIAQQYKDKLRQLAIESQYNAYEMEPYVRSEFGHALLKEYCVDPRISQEDYVLLLNYVFSMIVSYDDVELNVIKLIKEKLENM